MFDKPRCRHMQVVETEARHGAVVDPLELNVASHAQRVSSYQYRALLTPVNDNNYFLLLTTIYARNFYAKILNLKSDKFGQCNQHPIHARARLSNMHSVNAHMRPHHIGGHTKECTLCRDRLIRP